MRVSSDPNRGSGRGHVARGVRRTFRQCAFGRYAILGNVRQRFGGFWRQFYASRQPTTQTATMEVKS